MAEFKGTPNGEGRRIAVIVSRFNEEVTAKLLEGAVECLIRHGVRFQDVDVTSQAADGSADLSIVFEVIRSIREHLDGPKIVVIKSTVPVGTNDKALEILKGAKYPVRLASNPEFLKEGAAVEDFMKPDRIVVGAEDARAIDLMRELYAPFQRNHERLIMMDVRSAELTKYAANALLATKISFMNEIANMAEALGADIIMAFDECVEFPASRERVAEGMARTTRCEPSQRARLSLRTPAATLRCKAWAKRPASGWATD